MSPRTADPAVRPALIEAAARLLAEGGPAALSTRRLATEVGTSTMRIYTHFGSMTDLHAAVRREGFDRLAGALRAQADTGDPVTDLAAAALTYLRAALAAPELYRAMFNHRPPPGDDAGTDIFALLTDRVSRCLEAGRFPDADPARAAVWAGELWTALHGTVTLALSGILPAGQPGLLLADMIFRLAVGFGDGQVAARRSIEDAQAAFGKADRP